MPPLERSRIRIRQVIAAAVALLLVVVGVLAIRDALDQGAPPAKPTDSGPPTPAVDPQPLPVPSPYLGRAELLQAVSAASAAHAAGAPPEAGDGDLVGRSFQLRVPFGCSGPGTGTNGEPAYWEYDQKSRALRLSAAPETWTRAAWVREIAGGTAFDAVEGFWIPRPWSNSDACPPQVPTVSNEPPPTPSPQTFGLAQFFEPGGSRVLRRGSRPYEHVLKVEEPPLGRPQFSLVLGGRVVGYKDGRAIHCRSDGPDHRPLCLAAVDLDYVAFEDQATGEALAEWRN